MIGVRKLWQRLPMYAIINQLEEKTMTSLNISLTEQMRDWINAQITTGQYANASDYMRDLIRHDQRHYEQLNLELIEGEKSGVSKRKISGIIATSKAKLKQ